MPIMLQDEELARFPGLSRRAATALYLYHWDSLEDVREAWPAEVLRVPGIGMKTYTEIAQALGSGWETQYDLNARH